MVVHAAATGSGLTSAQRAAVKGIAVFGGERLPRSFRYIRDHQLILNLISRPKHVAQGCKHSRTAERRAPSQTPTDLFPSQIAAFEGLQNSKTSIPDLVIRGMLTPPYPF